MGHHIIPQFYLRAFTEDPADRNSSFLCQYNFETGAWNGPASIKKLLQKPGLYAEETETFLTYEVEAPAVAILKKLRKYRSGKIKLTDDERRIFSFYVACMYKRSLKYVVEQEQRADDSIKEACQRARVKYPDRLEEIDAFEARDEWPAEIAKEIGNPVPVPSWADHINMSWLFLFSPDRDFLTSDNPVVRLNNSGFGTPQAEFVFPISPRLVLYGNRAGKRGTDRATPQQVECSNEAIIKGAFQFVLYKRKAAWVESLIQKYR